MARRKLVEAFAAAGREAPENLWHALIFAAAGAFRQSVAVAEGLPPHTPYWIREGIGDFRGWSALVPAVTERWVPLVGGQGSRAVAFAALVDHFGR
jgi:hypothetical protein